MYDLGDELLRALRTRFSELNDVVQPYAFRTMARCSPAFRLLVQRKRHSPKPALLGDRGARPDDVRGRAMARAQLEMVDSLCGVRGPTSRARGFKDYPQTGALLDRAS